MPLKKTQFRFVVVTTVKQIQFVSCLVFQVDVMMTARSAFPPSISLVCSSESSKISALTLFFPIQSCGDKSSGKKWKPTKMAKSCGESINRAGSVLRWHASLQLKTKRGHSAKAFKSLRQSVDLAEFARILISAFCAWEKQQLF